MSLDIIEDTALRTQNIKIHLSNQTASSHPSSNPSLLTRKCSWDSHDCFQHIRAGKVNLVCFMSLPVSEARNVLVDFITPTVLIATFHTEQCHRKSQLWQAMRKGILTFTSLDGVIAVLAILHLSAVLFRHWCSYWAEPLFKKLGFKLQNVVRKQSVVEAAPQRITQCVEVGAGQSGVPARAHCC